MFRCDAGSPSKRRWPKPRVAGWLPEVLPLGVEGELRARRVSLRPPMISYITEYTDLGSYVRKSVYHIYDM